MEHELNLGSDTVFIASTLFFTHLRSLADRKESLDSAWYLHTGKLIGKRYFCVPICINDHYSMAFITDIWGTTQFFHYDSMGNYHNSDDLLALVAEYIRALRFTIPYPDPPAAVDLSGGNFYKLKGPIQPNSYDCGIYALKFIQTILNEIKSESADRYLSHSFNASVWTQIDVNSYRDEMFNAGSMIFQEHVVHLNMQDTQNHVKRVEESRNSTKHKSIPDGDSESNGKKKISLESFLLGLFGSYDEYLRLVPHQQDQDYVQQCYTQNLHLQDTFSSRKRNINCGYYRGDFWILSRFHFHLANNWAPTPHGISCWDRLPYNYNRYPKTYGHISFAALEGPNKKLLISSSPLFSEQDEHRYILWIPHLTTCWKPIKEWTLFDTQTERFIVVKGRLHKIIYNLYISVHILYYILHLDSFISDYTIDSEYKYTGKDSQFNDEEFLMIRYMNYIGETGRRYDIARHVKRTSKYFSPSEQIAFDSNTDEEDNQLKENEVDVTDILLEGYRQPDQLLSYLKTSVPGIIH